MKQVISTPKAPAAIGPYSQAIRVGNLIYTSGQIGRYKGADPPVAHQRQGYSRRGRHQHGQCY